MYILTKSLANIKIWYQFQYKKEPLYTICFKAYVTLQANNISMH